jgi:hypothetical protein
MNREENYCVAAKIDGHIFRTGWLSDKVMQLGLVPDTCIR